MAPAASTGPDVWAVLRHPVFRSLWIANVASGIGTTLHDTAAVWTMTTLTSSAMLVTLMQTMSSLPLFLLALPAGALADLADRRLVILAAQIGSLVATLALVLLSWSGGLTPVALLGVTLVLGIGAAFTMPTWQALLVDMVGKTEMAGAITLSGISINISRAVGPIVAGVVLAASGPTAAFALNAASFLGIIVVLVRWRRPPRLVGAHAERMVGAMITAVRFTRHSSEIQAVLLRTAGFVFFAIAPIALLPLVVRGRGMSAADFGGLMGAYGAGAIVAAFVVMPRIRSRFSGDLLLNGSTVVFALLTVALSVVASRVAMGLVLFGAGMAWLTAMSTLAIAAQSAFPDWVRARSSAIYLLSSQAALAVGALGWGRVTAASDLTLALRIAAGGLLLTLAVAKALAIGGAQRRDLTPSDHWGTHQIEREPADEDGPVLVTLDYVVPTESVRAFREAMARLRVVRLRDGAFYWSLHQSLEFPGRFRESFRVGSWGEHLRQHGRATMADLKIEQAVLALHTGAPPVAEHYLMENVRAATST